MFSDKRSKKVIILAHCLLNQNSISDGTADMPAQFDKVINLIMNNNIGIIQLPCPELTCLGLDRKDKNGARRELLGENSRIRTLMQTDEVSSTLKQKANELRFQVEDYLKHDFNVIGLIGVDRSPSCGVDTTSMDGKEMNGRGVFIRIIEEEFNGHGIQLRMIGTKTGQEQASVSKVSNFLI